MQRRGGNHCCTVVCEWTAPLAQLAQASSVWMFFMAGRRKKKKKVGGLVYFIKVPSVCLHEGSSPPSVCWHYTELRPLLWLLSDEQVLPWWTWLSERNRNAVFLLTDFWLLPFCFIYTKARKLFFPADLKSTLWPRGQWNNLKTCFPSRLKGIYMIMWNGSYLKKSAMQTHLRHR